MDRNRAVAEVVCVFGCVRYACCFAAVNGVGIRCVLRGLGMPARSRRGMLPGSGWDRERRSEAGTVRIGIAIDI